MLLLSGSELAVGVGLFQHFRGYQCNAVISDVKELLIFTAAVADDGARGYNAVSVQHHAK